jgi:hypothetical protein
MLITHLGGKYTAYMLVRVGKFHITGAVLDREEM